jgi:tRNA nucleotidyltransferase (CCA-adding enzyme)
MSVFPPQNLKARMKRILPGPLIGMIKLISALSREKGYPSFLVGGCVRDIILGSKTQDIDIVLEGNAIEFGAFLAERLKGTLVAHKKFGTAAVYVDWPRGVKRPPLAANKLKIDLATARKERYERPAALPTVEFSTLKDDLSRRDFSVNAMAISLNVNTFGQLIDFFNGFVDLREKRVRILHERSFIDDPTRIFRAVRFEQRFGFRIDPFTERLIAGAVKEKMFKRTENQRIREELILVLREKKALSALKRMDELHELKFIHKKIRMTAGMEASIKACYEAYLWYNKRYPRRRPVDLYIMYLMTLIERLTVSDLALLSEKFVFTRSDRIRLFSYKAGARNVSKTVSRPGHMKPSEVYVLLEPLSYEEILVIMTKAHDRGKKRIRNFMKELNGTKIKLKGDDLRAMGMKEGPGYKAVLSEVLRAKLDGIVRTKNDEMALARRIIDRRGIEGWTGGGI